MRKQLLLIFSILLCTTSFILAQTATLKTHGVDPREAEEDTLDIFNLAYNGMQNVGNNTQTYLVGQLTGATLNSPSWTIVQKPNGSNASFGATEDFNDSTQAIIFTPDITGLYVIQFSQGNASAQMKMHSADYVGYETAPSCGISSCHGDKVAEWQQTGHYMIFEEGLNGTLSNHYGPSCIKCHTTGYDTNADNGGFDDYPFVFPDTLMPGMFDSMMVAYPEAMKLARIQCESCHGPAGDHFADSSNFKIQSSLNFENCAWCHDEGTHHVFPTQWKASGHAAMNYGQTRAACAQCHNGAGFVDYIKNGKTPPTEDYADVEAISCAVCHDPHSVENPHQLRTVEVTLENGQDITNAGNGALCMNCHKARRDAVEYTNDYLNNLSSHYGPHHGPQGDMLAGTNAITFGQPVGTSPHLEATGDACVTCHMYPASSDADGNVILAGSHSFSMTFPDGTDNVAACSPCHGDIGTKFSDKKYYINGNADLDGNGQADGLQIEMEGLLHKLSMLLPPVGSTDVSITDSSVTLTQAQAAYNYFMVEEDRSLGIHNPAFAFGLMKASIEALGGSLAVGYDNGTTPHEFALEQNYPNPFNPTTKISFTIAKASHVKLDVYNVTGQLVKTIVDQDLSMGNHTYDFDATNLASGIYFYRIITPEFTATKKMVLLR